MRLPFNQSHLKRRDALGGAAKREACVHWAKRIVACKERIQVAEDDLFNIDGNDDIANRRRKSVKQRIAKWKHEHKAAVESYAEMQEAVRHAWD